MATTNHEVMTRRIVTSRPNSSLAKHELGPMSLVLLTLVIRKVSLVARVVLLLLCFFGVVSSHDDIGLERGLRLPSWEVRLAVGTLLPCDTNVKSTVNLHSSNDVVRIPVLFRVKSIWVEVRSAEWLARIDQGLGRLHRGTALSLLLRCIMLAVLVTIMGDGTTRDSNVGRSNGEMLGLGCSDRGSSTLARLVKKLIVYGR